MAMGRVESTRTSAATNQDQFRIPDLAAAPSILSSKVRQSPAAKPTTPETPASSASISRSWRRSSSRDFEAQPTLTQIDFVTVSQNLNSDDDLDYIGEAPQKSHTSEVIEIEDDLEDDADYRPPSTSRMNRARGVRFDQGKSSHATSKLKKSPNYGESRGKGGRRKSGDGPKVNKKDKSIDKKERHKTLTQMNYVRRYVKVPDEDVDLEYTYIAPKEKDTKLLVTRDNVGAQEPHPDQGFFRDASVPLKKRKLDIDPDFKGMTSLMDPHEEKEMSTPPVTPKKALRPEIPSSQSPESPGLAFITSSQFRSATRSPQKRTASRIIKKEVSPDFDLLPNATEYPQEPSTENHQEVSEFNERSSPLPRTVVYETDAESDYSDFQDDLPVLPTLPHNLDETAIDENCDDESLNIESQELPPVLFSRPDIDPGPLLSEGNPMSDASICYQRLQPATQFPLDPIPTINTQKLAELFPEESNGLQTSTMDSVSSSSMKSGPLPGPKFETQTQAQTQTQIQTQSQSQEGDKCPTEIVPESSPVTRGGDGLSVGNHRRSTQDAVIQVESSQPVDKFHKQAMMGQDSGPRGVLSRSQILTSSVMESIPLPAFWMNSQDSIGEPYSLPET